MLRRRTLVCSVLVATLTGAIATVTWGAQHENVSLPSVSGWTSDQPLSSSGLPSGLSINFARAIAVDESGSVHVVWFAAHEGIPQVRFKTSNDHGRTWSADVVLSDAAHGASHPAVAIAGPDVYVAWHDSRLRVPHVLVRHSGDRGMTWDREVLLSGASLQGAHASIAATGKDVHVVWASGTEGSSEVYLRSSHDRGVTWAPVVRISERPYASWVGSVEASGKDVYVAWVDYADANEEEYFRHSGDGGLTWDAPVRLTRDAADSWAPSLALSGRTVHIAWFDRRDAGVSDRDVETRLNDVLTLLGLEAPPPPARDPNAFYLDAFMQRVQHKVAVIQMAVPYWIGLGGDPRQFQALFEEFQAAMQAWTTGWEIYYKRSIDGGVTWGPDVRLTTAPGISARPSLAARENGTLHVVWFDMRDGDMEIYYKESLDEGLTWQPDTRLTRAAGGSELPSVGVSQQAVHVVWVDGREGRPQVYYKRGSR